MHTTINYRYSYEYFTTKTTIVLKNTTEKQSIFSFKGTFEKHNQSFKESSQTTASQLKVVVHRVRIVSRVCGPRYCPLRELWVGVVLSWVHQQYWVEIQRFPRASHAGRVAHESSVHFTWEENRKVHHEHVFRFVQKRQREKLKGFNVAWNFLCWISWNPVEILLEYWSLHKNNAVQAWKLGF